MSDARMSQEGFSATFYLQTVRAMLLAPGEFYGSLPDIPGFKRPFAFLVVSGLLHVALGLSFLFIPSLLMASIVLLNALAMPVITALLGHGLIVLLFRRKAAASKVFSLYAYAAGTTHLIAWIPLAVWISEPWKWILIGIGLMRAFGLRRLHAVLLVVLSIVMLIILFSILSPLLVSIKGWFSS